MMFGIILLLMTGATVTLLTRPLLAKRQEEAVSDSLRDMAIYRAQLDEVESDIARGLLTAAQAADTRAEIRRRMLAAAKPPEARATPPAGPRKICAAVIIVFLPLAAVFIYAMLGAPGLPDAPYAARMKNPRFLLATAAQRLDEKLQTAPTAAGYRRFADILYLLQDYVDSANAYRKAIARGEDTAELWSQMAETITLANGGMVVAQAQEAFYQALRHDKNDPRATFYMGLAEAQQGRFRKAVAIWKKLQSETPAGAPWAVLLKNRIDAAAQAGKFDAADIEPAAPAKPAAQGRPSPLTAQGQKMPAWAKDPAARAGMINAMVAALAAKLEKDPHDVQGWLRLIRSCRVLGEAGKAQAALAAALRLNPDNAQLEALAAAQK
ncbi:MAG: c-type cytochrome biogenesis protein CcmI [Alphaproteobacteria bacterium]|nr:c-type cytochrome biogenesis protein CcmI [Alphaproteobacteria bacterium]MDE2336761.1 c-type cytochrome biogenesis protein CcmI [Alphaproteobacteria bacterium]